MKIMGEGSEKEEEGKPEAKPVQERQGGSVAQLDRATAF